MKIKNRNKINLIRRVNLLVYLLSFRRKPREAVRVLIFNFSRAPSVPYDVYLVKTDFTLSAHPDRYLEATANTLDNFLQQKAHW